MSRRESVVTALAIFAAALAVRAVAAAAIPYPVPEDTASYVSVARNLVEGHGLVSDALWSYQTPPLVVPRAAFEVWLPLPTFLAALPMLLFGATFAAAQVAAVLVGALVPVLAWRLAADVAEERGFAPGRARVVAVGTGLVAAAFGPLVVHGALPDSTMPFAVLALASCLLMARILRDPRGARPSDGRLLGLGAAIGLAALARNEALWVALTWALLAWWGSGRPLDRRTRFRLIAVPAVVAVACYAPWMVRDWIEFGSPLPGQALANALSVTGFDIFAWQDRPTLARYLAQGVGSIVGARIDGLSHNLVTVLLVPALPAGPIGLAALPWQGRGRSIRPLLVLSVLTFTATTVLFPVATEWGTFLHAAGPVHVLLLVAAVFGIDAVIAAVGRRRGWTRPVAWLGPLLVAATAVPLLVISVASIAGVAVTAQDRYQGLASALDATGTPASARSPIVADFPIWTAWSLRVPTLGLPDESPSSVLDLARHFGARLLVVSSEHGRWPDILAGDDPAARCFVPLPLPDPTGHPGALADTRAWAIGCP